MRRLFLAVVVALMIVNISVSASAQTKQVGQENGKASLQPLVDSLQVGVSNLDNIEQLFGKPENLRRTIERHTEPTMQDDRYLVIADYPSRGLFFSLLGHPSELYSITIGSKDVSVHGIHVGDSLEKVTQTLPQGGVWTTSLRNDWWWLDFKSFGVKYGFERDKSKEKQPMNLAKPEVVSKIEIYNSKITFY
ncbi:MAG TPA: hypothetical protein DCZ69_08110 [Syntrophobacteraceae bacterium]|nr:hypothetical protein [Syntrophobacteraceae bacterium]